MRPKDESKRLRILEAAMEVVGEQGLASLSIEAVAKAAGVSVGTIYVYFKGKEALINELYLHAKAGFSRAVFGVDAELPVRPSLEQMSVAYLRYVTENQPAVLLMRQLQHSSFLHEQSREMAAQTILPLSALLERGKAEGLIKDLPTPLLIAFIHGTLAELAGFAGAQPRKQRAQTFASVAQLVWDAIKA
ncbi:TetR/AcrR family transcriptional regulator [Pseudenhygromyxa sp. WMMC2535]|uniref:TetR/AcrR family transcriptional regulator n=1 Tax=Pseudenhygromyxa sp. WMMC2535 TaxID=2712867 RepID=UPI0015540BC1|nr:TetR/AcrR family transcriptional regulator [Pseudenhygromyxa sp. WMMC2535]NVB40674.1 TetR/AcrR family transcriptional regulator [Pseudenhygromyxa sp. WMMC2535]